MKAIPQIVVFLFCVTCPLRSATLVFEADLNAPLVSGGFLTSGNFFLRLNGDSAEYQIWSGELDDPNFEIQSATGDSFSGILGDSRVVRLSGCNLTPRNPFLPFGPSEVLILPPVTCTAFKDFQVYEGVISDPSFIALISSGDDLSVSYNIVDTFSSSLASGRLNQVPEPSSLGLISLAMILIIRRNRQGEQNAESQMRPR